MRRNANYVLCSIDSKMFVQPSRVRTLTCICPSDEVVFGRPCRTEVFVGRTRMDAKCRSVVVIGAQLGVSTIQSPSLEIIFRSLLRSQFATRRASSPCPDMLPGGGGNSDMDMEISMCFNVHQLDSAYIACSQILLPSSYVVTDNPVDPSSLLHTARA